jgi:DNA-binding NtrC family response regulator
MAERNILVVDVGPGADFALRHMLTFFRWDVGVARDRREAESLLLAGSYRALVIELWDSPDMIDDGLGLLAFARSLRPAVPVIMVADAAARAIEQEAERGGIAAFLVRPQTATAVHRALCELLELRQ